MLVFFIIHAYTLDVELLLLALLLLLRPATAPALATCAASATATSTAATPARTAAVGASLVAAVNMAPLVVAPTGPLPLHLSLSLLISRLLPLQCKVRQSSIYVHLEKSVALFHPISYPLNIEKGNFPSNRAAAVKVI